MNPLPLLPYLLGLVPILLARSWQARIVAIIFGIAFVFRYANGSELLFLFVGCIVIPLLGYVMFARYLARQMGLTCSSCGRRMLSE